MTGSTTYEARPARKPSVSVTVDREDTDDDVVFLTSVSPSEAADGARVGQTGRSQQDKRGRDARDARELREPREKDEPLGPPILCVNQTCLVREHRAQGSSPTAHAQVHWPAIVLPFPAAAAAGPPPPGSAYFVKYLERADSVVCAVYVMLSCWWLNI